MTADQILEDIRNKRKCVAKSIRATTQKILSCVDEEIAAYIDFDNTDECEPIIFTVSNNVEQSKEKLISKRAI